MSLTAPATFTIVFSDQRLCYGLTAAWNQHNIDNPDNTFPDEAAYLNYLDNNAADGWAKTWVDPPPDDGE